MKKLILLAVTVFTFLATVPSGWSQIVPETNPKLAPKINAANPTSSESLAAQSQDLTKKINEAKAQGKNTSAAAVERMQGEKAIQQGNADDAVRHFKAGDRALSTDESQAPQTPSN
jgi:hypothetical protein